MGVKACALVALITLTGPCLCAQAQGMGAVIPATQATSLSGQNFSLPHDLPGRATILILGFGRHSQDATTAWEKPTRTQLAHPGSIGFYDMAMLAEIPGFMRSFALHAIKHAVPDVLKPNFLPLFDQEDAWKRVAGYDTNQPDAAYVLLVDSTGHVQWATHAPYSEAGFTELRHRAADLASKGH